MKLSQCFCFIIPAILTLVALTSACGKKTAENEPNRPNAEDSSQSTNHEQDRSSEELKDLKWGVEECSSWKDPDNGNQIEYCIKTIKNFEGSGRSLYAFHGMGGGAKEMCSRVTSDIEPYKSAKKISHVICPSFGPSWVIHEKGRTDSFFRFKDFIQTQYKASAEQKPVLYGESMGGFNVVKLSQAGDANQLQFHKVGAACPAIFYRKISDSLLNYSVPALAFSPFDKETSISIITSSPYFDRSKNVVYPELSIMANVADTVGTYKFNISGWKFDALGGIYEGAKEFYATLPATQLKSFRELPGGHCEGIPLNQMIEFLAE